MNNQLIQSKIAKKIKKMNDAAKRNRTFVEQCEKSYCIKWQIDTEARTGNHNFRIKTYKGFRK
jgi:hypothetical protein